MATVVLWLKRLFLFAVLGFVAAALFYALSPQAVAVDLVTVERGELAVTIRDEGQTRVRDRYVVSAPLSGQMERIFVKEGDEVIAGETVVARILPSVPGLLDARERARAEALIQAAEGRLSRSQAELRRSREELEQAQIDVARFQQLKQGGAATDAQVEIVQLAFRQKTESLKSAEFQEVVSKYELEIEKAAMRKFNHEPSPGDVQTQFEVKSPISGSVLRLTQESARFVTSGMPIVEVGDSRRIEVIADMLSNDAVKIRAGQSAKFVHWGGVRDLPAVVRLVEPSGFTKISALGVEEQRVNILCDFIGEPEEYQSLRDGYRVEVEIEVWSQADTLKVPASALFRRAREWAVFCAIDGRAVIKEVKIGQNNGLFAEVLEGLAEGDQVISHPSDQIQEQGRIRARG